MTRTGQSAAEYAIVLGVVVAALVAMQVYVKRGMNARIKMGSDSAVSRVLGQLGQPNTGTNLLYEPYYSSSQFDVTRDTNQTRYEETGGIVKHDNIKDTTVREGYQATGAAQ